MKKYPDARHFVLDKLKMLNLQIQPKDVVLYGFFGRLVVIA
jgi:hypothetical protein